MKWIVFLTLLTNTVLAQEILVPRNIVESCRENYDIIAKLKDKSINQDSIINNRDKRIETDSIKIFNYQQAIRSLLTVATNDKEIIKNKDIEIKSTKNTLNLFIGISGLELLILILLLL